LTFEEFREVFLKPNIQDLLSSSEIRKRLSPIVVRIQSKIVPMIFDDE